jgi:CheY-like chemotaxis protein
MLLEMGTLMLKRRGYTGFPADSPGEALKRAEAHAGEIDLLITDVVMPGMNGRDLARSLQRFYPDLKVMFMPGYTADLIAHHEVLDEAVHFLQKPFTLKDLAAKVREALRD